MDDTDILPPDDISVYQILIGCLQWAATLVRYDVQYATNALARFGEKPQDDHSFGPASKVPKLTHYGVV